MAKRKEFGKCRICGNDGQLSFEHVPPQAAFNNAPAVGYTMDEHLRAEGDLALMRGEKSQRGVGAFTLCIKCNNDTGAWYGTELRRMGKEWIRNS
jgi:5-methylcytosine-specific restriction endonuclease McrA